MNRILWIGPLIFGLSTAIPTTLCVLFGQTIVTLILNYVPDWVTSGLTIAGNMLPVVGIALLLQVMPAKKYLSLLLIGFVLTAYLNLPILGVSIVGLALAYYYFTTTIQKVTTSNLNTVEEIGDDFDE